MRNLYANWPAPPTISALTTTRKSGSSAAPFAANNLGLHVGDDLKAVLANRQALKSSLGLTQEPEWLEQTHSNHCVLVEEEPYRHADAAVTRSQRHCLAIMTADCLPILLCNQQGSEIAAIHAGWRGLATGIVENTLKKIHSVPQQLMAWIGPAICQSCFEVGEEMRQIYQERYPFTLSAFKSKEMKWLADLPSLAEKILNANGVCAVYHSGICTFEQKNSFYSYRREAQTGRMATLIWFNTAMSGIK